MCLEIPVRRPAVTDDVSAGFDSGSKNIHQGVSSSVRNGNEKCLPALALNTAKDSLPLKRVAPVVFAVIDFYGLVRTANLLRAALQIHQHGLSAELAPISDRFRTKLMLLLDNVGRYTAHDVVCEDHNLHEIEATLLKP
jgi:hypothetical protein